MLYDFGAACVTYSILCGPGDLSIRRARDNAALLIPQQRRFAGESIRRPFRSRALRVVEGFVIYQIERWTAAEP